MSNSPDASKSSISCFLNYGATAFFRRIKNPSAKRKNVQKIYDLFFACLLYFCLSVVISFFLLFLSFLPSTFSFLLLPKDVARPALGRASVMSRVSVVVHSVLPLLPRPRLSMRRFLNISFFAPWIICHDGMDVWLLKLLPRRTTVQLPAVHTSTPSFSSTYSSVPRTIYFFFTRNDGTYSMMACMASCQIFCIAGLL